MRPVTPRFFIHWLALMSTALFSTALFQLLGAVTRNEVMAQGMGAVALLICIATSGYPIARSA